MTPANSSTLTLYLLSKRYRGGYFRIADSPPSGKPNPGLQVLSRFGATKLRLVVFRLFGDLTVWRQFRFGEACNPQ